MPLADASLIAGIPDGIALLLFILFGWALSQINKAIAHRRRLKEEKLKASLPPEPKCGCKHHFSFHDPETGRCNYTETITSGTQEVVRDRDGDPVLDPYGRIQKIKKTLDIETVQCGCQRYVGPEPLRTLYAQDYSDVAAQKVTPLDNGQS